MAGDETPVVAFLGPEGSYTHQVSLSNHHGFQIVIVLCLDFFFPFSAYMSISLFFFLLLSER